jgi:Skp family chaperone for outer membrane proteins
LIIHQNNRPLVSIQKLVNDIDKSVKDPDAGYLAKSNRNEDNLQANLENAIKQVYESEDIGCSSS